MSWNGNGAGNFTENMARYLSSSILPRQKSNPESREGWRKFSERLMDCSFLAGVRKPVLQALHIVTCQKDG